MENCWNPETDETLANDQQRIAYLGELLSQAPEILFSGVGRLSLKGVREDPFGKQIDVLYYGIEKNGSVELLPYALEDLTRISRLSDPSQVNLALGRTRLEINSPLPDYGVVYHALLPGKVVAFTRPTALMALDLFEGGQEKVEVLLEGSVLWINDPPGALLAKTLDTLNLDEDIKGIFIHRYGLFSFGKTSELVYQNIRRLESAAQISLEAPIFNPCTETTFIPEGDSIREDASLLRKMLSERAGTPLLMKVLKSAPLLKIAEENKRLRTLQAGSLSFAQEKTFHNGFLDQENLPENLPFNNALLDPHLGLCVTGQSAADLVENEKLICQTLQTALAAWEQGADSLTSVVNQDMLNYSIVQESPEIKPFLGEVALVTGAASGIGRGCVLSLLDRGAAVIGLDVNPEIKNLSVSPAFLGLVCDLTDETAVRVALETVGCAFGGLDMIVLNAGIFTKSALIKDLDLSLWQQVMRINLDANVTVLRDTYPLLRNAPKGGRVLVNASRNVPAPGPGAAAYSTSKAGLTQLARVAALEWGQDGIRVNVIHPHAVFDTGIWTEEVLKSRAEKYGISVEEYKTRNVLKVELTSRDIGELVCVMLGPAFSKTTGAQVPVDGGSERVI